MEKYKNLKKTFFIIGIFRVLIIISNFVITALLIRVLGRENFGIYVALLSVFTWMFLFDLGLGKGMRNYVTKALSNNNYNLAKQYISTSYISIFIITLILYILAMAIISTIDLSALLNINTIEENNLFNIMTILITFFFIKFFLGLVDQNLYAIHRSEIVTINTFNTNLLYIFGLVIILIVEPFNSMLNVALSFGIAMLISYSIATIWFFYKHDNLLPSVRYFSIMKFGKIINDGYKILLIQLSFLLIVGLDRLIILKYLTPGEVADYDITYKVMSLLLFPFSIIAQPLWSSYTEAYARKDMIWIKKTYKKLYIMSGIMLIGVFILAYFINDITRIWLGITLSVDLKIVIAIGFLMLLTMWSTMHSDFLMGINKYKISLVSIIIGLFIKFILLYFLYKTNTLNLFAVVFSAIAGYSIFCLISPFYVKRLIASKKDE